MQFLNSTFIEKAISFEREIGKSKHNNSKYLITSSACKFGLNRNLQDLLVPDPITRVQFVHHAL